MVGIRYAYPIDGNGTTTDQNGRILTSVTVSAFLTGTTIPAKIYSSVSSIIPVNSIISDYNSGSFIFYVDDLDYPVTQKFDITFVKTQFLTKKVIGVSIYYTGPMPANLYEVMASATDSAPGYLDAKVDNTTITVTDDKLTVIGEFDTYEVMASATDSAPGYLDAKVDNTTITVTDDKLTVKAAYAFKTEVQDGSLIYGVDTGLANAYVITLSPAITSYVDGMGIRFRAIHANTMGSTLKVNGLAALPMRKIKNGVPSIPLEVGDIVANQDIDVIYNGAFSNFQIQLGNSSIADTYEVKASAADPTPGFLDAKVDGTTIDVTNNKLTVLPEILVSSQWCKPVVTNITYINAMQFCVDGNKTDIFQIGRRIQAVVTTGTITGTIFSAVHAILTTVTCVWDSGELDSGLIKIYLGILTVFDWSDPVKPTRLYNTDYILTNADINQVFIISSHFNRQFTLLTADKVPSGSWVKLINAGPSLLSVIGIINGEINLEINQHGQVVIISDGTSWWANTTTEGGVTPKDVQNRIFIYAEDYGIQVNEYAISIVPDPEAVTKGMLVGFQAATTNTGPATLNLNFRGPLTIKKNNDIDLVYGDIRTGQMVDVAYDGVNWQMMSVSGNGGGGGGVTPADIQSGDLVFAADTSTTENEYVIALSPVPAQLYVGMEIRFWASASNTGTATLKVNDFDAIQITKNGQFFLVANDIVGGQMVDVAYDGVNWQMLSVGGNGTNDISAYHKDISQEILLTPAKTTLDYADVLLIESSTDGFSKKSILMSDFSFPDIDSSAFHSDKDAEFGVLIPKNVLANTDQVLIEDSEDSFMKKYTTIASLPQDTYTVMATSTDTTPGYLDTKVDDVTIGVVNDQLTIVPSYALKTDVQNANLIYADDVGTTDEYFINITPFPSVYVKGMAFRIEALNTNTIGNPTLNVNSLGTKTICRAGGSVLLAGDIQAGQMFEVAYDGTQFQMVSVTSSAWNIATYKVMAASDDPSPGFLDAKVDGTTIIVSDDHLVAIGGGGDTYMVKATATDPTPGFLTEKVDNTTIKVVSNQLEVSGAVALKTDVLDMTFLAASDNSLVPNVFVVNLTPAPLHWPIFMALTFIARNTNTGPSTLTVNGWGPNPITKNKNLDLDPGDILIDQMVDVVWDGGIWQMQSQLGNPNVSNTYSCVDLGGGYPIYWNQTGNTFNFMSLASPDTSKESDVVWFQLDEGPILRLRFSPDTLNIPSKSKQEEWDAAMGIAASAFGLVTIAGINILWLDGQVGLLNISVDRISFEVGELTETVGKLSEEINEFKNWEAATKDWISNIDTWRADIDLKVFVLHVHAIQGWIYLGDGPYAFTVLNNTEDDTPQIRAHSLIPDYLSTNHLLMTQNVNNVAFRVMGFVANVQNNGQGCAIGNVVANPENATELILTLPSISNTDIHNNEIMISVMSDFSIQFTVNPLALLKNRFSNMGDVYSNIDEEFKIRQYIRAWNIPFVNTNAPWASELLTTRWYLDKDELEQDVWITIKMLVCNWRAVNDNTMTSYPLAAMKRYAPNVSDFDIIANLYTLPSDHQDHVYRAVQTIVQQNLSVEANALSYLIRRMYSVIPSENNKQTSVFTLNTGHPYDILLKTPKLKNRDHINKISGSNEPINTYYDIIGDYDSDDDELPEMIFMNIAVDNNSGPSVLNIAYATGTLTNDTISLSVDCSQITLLGQQSQALEMGGNAITNLSPQSPIYSGYGTMPILSHEEQVEFGLLDACTIAYTIMIAEAAVITYPGIGSTLHYNIANEIYSNIPLKSDPIADDMVLIEDSEDGWSKKRAPYPGGSVSSSSQWYSPIVTGLTYSNYASFTISGNQTTDFHSGRAVQAICSTKTLTGTITNSNYLVGSNITAVYTAWETGGMDNTLSQINLSILTAKLIALPVLPIIEITDSYTPVIVEPYQIFEIISDTQTTFTLLDGSYYPPGAWIKILNSGIAPVTVDGMFTDGLNLNLYQYEAITLFSSYAGGSTWIKGELYSFLPDSSWIIDRRIGLLTYINSTSFSCEGNVTYIFQQGRKIQVFLASESYSNIIQGIIVSSVLQGMNTVVTCKWDSGNINTDLQRVTLGPKQTTLPISPVIIKSSSYTLVNTDINTTFEMSSSTPASFTLLNAALVVSGTWLHFINSGSGVVTIVGTVSGVVNPTLNLYDEITVTSDGGLWFGKLPGGGTDTYEVKASATDPAPGFLNAKVDGTTITVIDNKLTVPYLNCENVVWLTPTSNNPIQLDNSNLNTFFIINTHDYSANIYLPLISSQNAGAAIRFIILPAPFGILSLNSHVGPNTLNGNHSSINVLVSGITIDVISDGVNNWIVNSPMYSRPNIGTEFLAEFENNAAAVAGGLGLGDIYRTGEFLKAVYTIS